jgi:curli biogenesis system outer membrane secretion channel CsgG
MGKEMKLSKFNVISVLTVSALLLGSLNVNAANKPIIGVGEITSNIQNANPETFQTMLETALVKTNKFEIIERSRLDDVLGERALGMAGITDQNAGLSGVQGVDYLIYGSITKLGETKKQTNFLIAGLNKNDKVYEMGVDLRLVDVSTGKIVRAENVDLDSKSGGSFTLGGLAGYGALGTSSSEGDPLGDIQRMTAIEVAGVVTLTISPIKVMAAQSDGTIVLNYGEVVLQDEDYLRLFEIGEGFADPDTGEILGAEEIEIGIIQVTKALPKYTKTKLVSGSEPVVGMLARKVSDDDVKALKKEIKKANKKRK